MSWLLREVVTGRVYTPKNCSSRHKNVKIQIDFKTYYSQLYNIHGENDDLHYAHDK